MGEFRWTILISQHPFIDKPEFLTSTESGILSISKYRKVGVKSKGRLSIVYHTVILRMGL